MDIRGYMIKTINSDKQWDWFNRILNQSVNKQKQRKLLLWVGQNQLHELCKVKSEPNKNKLWKCS
jgi:hypothetical protein